MEGMWEVKRIDWDWINKISKKPSMNFLWRNRLKIFQLGSRYMVRAAGLVNGLGHGWGEPDPNLNQRTQ
jgi:hypothetical protein